MKKRYVSIISILAGIAIGAVAAGKIVIKNLDKMKELSSRHFSLFQLMDQWVKVKQEGKNVASYLEENGYQKIAIYGMSYVGETLLEELKNTSVRVAYGIDKKGDTIYTDIDVITMDDSFDEVDAIVVTAITFFDEIEKELSERVSCPIISLEDILYHM
ncbi:MAG: hypothetical protein NC489_24425 [Ruminococcus flavefaciens]|nr:hypothetical protein [Ruminococcus flavefaciens]